MSEQLSAEEREALGVHTPVWDHDDRGFSLDCGCGEFTHFGVTRAEAEARWADHIAPAVEAILTARLADLSARLAAVEALATRRRDWRTWDEAADAIRAALHPDPSEAGADVEVREVWALRFADGTTSTGMYGDAAEHTVRMGAGGDTGVVRRTETITRTPWTPVPSPAQGAGAEEAEGRG